PGLSISIGGSSYSAGIFEPSGIELEVSGESGATLKLANVDNVFSTKDLSESALDKTVILYEVYNDSGTWRSEEKFRGRIEGVAWGEDAAEIALDPLPAYAGGIVGRVSDRDRCDYVFKGTSGRCGYSGAETWCDHTYARCSALGNTARWGGVCRLAAYPGQKFQWRVAREAPMSTRAGSTPARQKPARETPASTSTYQPRPKIGRL
ncbi:MAG: hypothetical protein ACOY3Y_04165, partial [Acidobacteriota bacterium]